MMRLVSFLSCAALLAAGTAASAGDPQEIEQKGPFRHVGSATVFPESWGAFKRARIVRYDDASGEDSSVSYDLSTPQGRVLLTEYIYPAPAVAAPDRAKT